jgi:hypothetical protein
MPRMRNHVANRVYIHNPDPPSRFFPVPAVVVPLPSSRLRSEIGLYEQLERPAAEFGESDITGIVLPRPGRGASLTAGLMDFGAHAGDRGRTPLALLPRLPPFRVGLA